MPGQVLEVPRCPAIVHPDSFEVGLRAAGTFQRAFATMIQTAWEVHEHGVEEVDALLATRPGLLKDLPPFALSATLKASAWQGGIVSRFAYDDGWRKATVTLDPQTREVCIPGLPVAHVSKKALNIGREVTHCLLCESERFNGRPTLRLFYGEGWLSPVWHEAFLKREAEMREGRERAARAAR